MGNRIVDRPCGQQPDIALRDALPSPPGLIVSDHAGGNSASYCSIQAKMTHESLRASALKLVSRELIEFAFERLIPQGRADTKFLL